MHPITYRRTYIMVCLVWLYGLFWALLPFFGVGEYVLEGYGVNCTFQYLRQTLRNKLYVGIMYFGAFIIPVTIMIICYWRIHRLVRATQHNLMADENGHEEAGKRLSDVWKGQKRLSHDQVGETGKSLRVEVQIAIMCAFLTVFFIASWTPYATLALIGQYISTDFVSPMLQLITVVVAKCSSAWNPFLYAIMHSSFRSALRHQINLKIYWRQKFVYKSSCKENGCKVSSIVNNNNS